jgi:hypothetical protein
VQRLARDDHFALGGGQQPARQRQPGRLAAARGPAQQQRATLGDLHVGKAHDRAAGVAISHLAAHYHARPPGASVAQSAQTPRTAKSTVKPWYPRALSACSAVCGRFVQIQRAAPQGAVQGAVAVATLAFEMRHRQHAGWHGLKTPDPMGIHPTQQQTGQGQPVYEPVQSDTIQRAAALRRHAAQQVGMGERSVGMCQKPAQHQTDGRCPPQAVGQQALIHPVRISRNRLRFHRKKVDAKGQPQCMVNNATQLL